MKNGRYLTDKEMEEVNGGGLLGGDKKQFFQVGDKLIHAERIFTRHGKLTNPDKLTNVTVIKCLGLNKGILRDNYEYMVRCDATGKEFKAKQSSLRRFP